jgi:DNA helicase II / ATP-dependent DNA helicase PcrA
VPVEAARARQFELSAEQRAALEAPPGPLLIVAGPGSGKTLTLTHRAAHLIATGQVRPEHLLAITFTNRAAEELAVRLRALVGLDAAELLTVGTFHAVCHRMLRPYADRVGRSQRFSIYDAADSRRACVEALREEGLEGQRAEDLARAIGLAKARLETPERLEAGADREARETAQAWRRYERLLAESDALDFEDLIAGAVQLLGDEELRERFQARHHAILVDEFQDTNPAQQRWVGLLAGERPNLSVVADDDQAIYGWRAAELGGMLGFEADFPGARTVTLAENHRSSEPIVAGARRLIEHNTERWAKPLVSAVGPGPAVRLEAHRDEREEARAALAWCRAHIRAGVPAGELTLLYRARALAHPLEQLLASAAVPYRVLGGQGVFERAEVRDALAHLTLVVNPRDRAAFARAICTRRGIGPVAVARLAAFATDHGVDLLAAATRAGEVAGLKAEQVRECERFGGALTLVAEQSSAVGVADTVSAAVFASGLPGKYRRRADREAAERLERLRQLVRAAKAYERDAGSPSLPEFLGQLALLSDGGQDGAERERVALGTVHAAKGLEWRCVRIVGLEEGVFPSRHALAEGRLEEERRLAYVALTRARTELVLSWARQCRGAEQTRSRFVAEAAPDAEPASPGMAQHPGAPTA